MLKNLSKELLLVVSGHNREKDILKLMKYNKILQTHIGIGVKFYKYFSKRYIIYDNKSKVGKEYNDKDILIYIGEYLNGERNGNGREFNEKNELTFYGSYSNGKRNGKGIEYNGKGKLLFEGDYSNGKRNGQGIEYRNR